MCGTAIPPAQLDTQKILHLYGWVPFNSGCPAAANALADTPGVDFNRASGHLYRYLAAKPNIQPLRPIYSRTESTQPGHGRLCVLRGRRHQLSAIRGYRAYLRLRRDHGAGQSEPAGQQKQGHCDFGCQPKRNTSMVAVRPLQPDQHQADRSQRAVHPVLADLSLHRVGDRSQRQVGRGRHRAVPVYDHPGADLSRPQAVDSVVCRGDDEYRLV